MEEYYQYAPAPKKLSDYFGEENGINGTWHALLGGDFPFFNWVWLCIPALDEDDHDPHKSFTTTVLPLMKFLQEDAYYIGEIGESHPKYFKSWLLKQPWTDFKVSGLIRRYVVLGRLEECIARFDKKGQQEKPNGGIKVVPIRPGLAHGEVTLHLSNDARPLATSTPQNQLDVASIIDSVPQSNAAITQTSNLLRIALWIADKHSCALPELRNHLLPLDLLPSAVIDDINERALDLTGELALLEEGDNIIVQREVLLQVIAD